MYNDPNAQPPYGQSPYTSPYEQQYSQQPAQPSSSTQYGASPPPGTPPAYVVPPPQKQSNKTLWIVLGVIGGIILLVGGGCCAAISLGVFSGAQAINSAVKSAEATQTVYAQTAIAQEPSPQQQADNYYTAISVQDYSNAYNYLAPNLKLSDGTALTQAKFTQEAQAQDTSLGQVTNATATADPTDSTKVTVQVTRQQGKTYTVHLTFIQGDYQWVISSFDNI